MHGLLGAADEAVERARALGPNQTAAAGPPRPVPAADTGAGPAEGRRAGAAAG
jgi:hypothetical protein